MLRNLEQEKRLDQRVVEATDPVGQVLLAAADYLEKHGWSRYHANGDNGEVCAFIAIKRVAGSLTPGGLGDLALGRFAERTGLVWRGIVDWNSHCRSKEEAIAVLRYAGGRQP